MLKNKKGITLVALVVTIVVLLILAGVSINLVLGNNGIIAKAKEAQRKSAEASQNDLKGMNGLVSEMEGALTGNGNNGGETQIPEITIGEAKVVANSDGTGSAITEAASVYLGNTLHITFSHSITGGTTTVDKTIPYAVTKNGTYTFTVTGTVNGKSYTKNVSVVVTQFKEQYMSENAKITFSDGDVWVPEGFRISEDSATTVSNGVVIEDKSGNQFVWIPVENVSDYKRTWYKGYLSLSKYSETLPSDEKTSVTTYKGFYIGRYEAGDKESSDSKMFRNSTDISKSVTIKANQAPYNYVSKEQAKSLAEGFGSKQDYKATTKLVSSYAWDTTIAFLQKANSDYGSSSEEGNYKDTTITYTDITGVVKTKESGDSILIPTGQTTPICNIYDMGGNVWEWTTETFSNSSLSTFTECGGGYGSSYSDCSAGYRDGGTNEISDKRRF